MSVKLRPISRHFRWDSSGELNKSTTLCWYHMNQTDLTKLVKIVPKFSLNFLHCLFIRNFSFNLSRFSAQTWPAKIFPRKCIKISIFRWMVFRHLCRRNLWRHIWPFLRQKQVQAWKKIGIYDFVHFYSSVFTK